MIVRVGFAAPAPAPKKFSGQSALDFTRSIVEFGPRPSGSEAHRRMQTFIEGKLKAFGCTTQTDVWTASTPVGPRQMKNIIVRIPGARPGRIVAITGHYDTKAMPGIHFVGANDGGSSAGLLLELARTLCGTKPPMEVRLVWLDGEEATRREWSTEDSLYGSRRLAAQWTTDGTARQVQAVINVDMIGDRDLAVVEEWNSTASLRQLVWDTAAELGYKRHFPRNSGAIEDDHIPFLRAGMPALDLIDFDYGPGNSYWHSDRDTLDKLSAVSFDVIGQVLLRVIERMGRN